MDIKTSKTEREFNVIEFSDRYGEKCSIQKSSLATENAIWFGITEAEPKILASKIQHNGTGWATYPLHPDVFINTRMHLTQKQVKQLLPYLIHFAETGELNDT
jgi:hypothetical protein